LSGRPRPPARHDTRFRSSQHSTFPAVKLSSEDFLWRTAMKITVKPRAGGTQVMYSAKES